LTVSEFVDVYDPSRSGCLLLDIRLPGGGLELLETLVASENSLPVIVITGYSDIETKGRALRLGAVAFFEKPFDVPQLCECIRDEIEPPSDKS
jgi:two-component system response regulator FixJ